MTDSFSSLKLSPEVLKNLESMGYTAMTPIQAQSLPHILNGKDVIGQGKTGSGKTAAFGLGLLASLDANRYEIQSLVLCPTRELADQVAKALRQLARTTPNVKILTLCGGVPFRPQAASLEHGAHIIVGTPGRIEDHLRRHTLDLQAVNVLVLDEADRMLDMGFEDSVENIVAELPAQRQTLLFSATFQDEIKAIAKRIMNSPVTAEAELTHDEVTIDQHFYCVDNDQEQRVAALHLLLMKHELASAVVFCNTKVETREVAEALDDAGFSVLALHGDLEQRDRDKILVQFSNGSATILVATDVAARGLDIDSIEAVFNYHLAHDPEIHVHRVGRTGRAGNRGKAFTFFTDREQHKMAALEEYIQKKLTAEALPPKEVFDRPMVKPQNITLRIDGGKRQKVRPGDILGALTGKGGIDGKQVGKINIFDNFAYVAVNRDIANEALTKLSEGKLKGRSFRVWRA